MGLSARTDDFTGLPLGSSFITMSTSGLNGLVFASPASWTQYLAANGAQIGVNNGSFNTETSLPQA